MALADRIASGTAEIGIIGLGYVGLTEALAFAGTGFRVTGFEIDADRVAAIAAGRSYVSDITDEELTLATGTSRLVATADFSRLPDADAVLICVPTPLSKTKAPDLSYIAAAVREVAARLRRDQLIVLESTTYPGTTTEELLPALAATELEVGRDFYVCFSPERINPGDQLHPPSKITRVVGGVTPRCAAVAADLFAWVSPEVRVVSSPRAAEMVKLLENTFRAVNIGLVNELALMCRALDVDVWEIIEAAATKPFGFMPFYPGPGLGGHCIPIDPLYLGWKARVNGFEPRFIDLASQVNAAMPQAVVSLVIEALNARWRTVNGSLVLVLGVSYKRDVNDARESPAVTIIEELVRRGAVVVYHDPHVPTLEAAGRTFRSVTLDDDLLQSADCVCIVTDHQAIDYGRLVDLANLVVDTRNATRHVARHRDRIVRL